MAIKRTESLKHQYSCFLTIEKLRMTERMIILPFRWPGVQVSHALTSKMVYPFCHIWKNRAGIIVLMGSWACKFLRNNFTKKCVFFSYCRSYLWVEVLGEKRDELPWNEGAQIGHSAWGSKQHLLSARILILVGLKSLFFLDCFLCLDISLASVTLFYLRNRQPLQV